MLFVFHTNITPFAFEMNLIKEYSLFCYQLSEISNIIGCMYVIDNNILWQISAKFYWTYVLFISMIVELQSYVVIENKKYCNFKDLSCSSTDQSRIRYRRAYQLNYMMRWSGFRMTERGAAGCPAQVLSMNGQKKLWLPEDKGRLLSHYTSSSNTQKTQEMWRIKQAGGTKWMWCAVGLHKQLSEDGADALDNPSKQSWELSNTRTHSDGIHRESDIAMYYTQLQYLGIHRWSCVCDCLFAWDLQ